MRWDLRVLAGTLQAGLALGLLFFSNPVMAWDTHALLTESALQSLGLEALEPVKIEEFDSFLLAEKAEFSALLEQEETWARSNLKNYAPRPGGLKFKLEAEAGELRQIFLKALRVNPNTPLALYQFILPGEPQKLSSIGFSEVSLIYKSVERQKAVLKRITAGDTMKPKDVILSAVDEPDYGLDIGLWEDSGTEWGASFGFGKIPFGNPLLEFSTQAPFHMGFFHESPIIFKAAPYLLRTYPEMRIHQFLTLSHFAFKKRHAYWGYRFLGWGLHYIQDLSQPYHARVLPGASPARMLWINTLSIFGLHRLKEEAITLVSNRHLALENFQWSAMRKAYIEHDLKHPLVLAPASTAFDARFGNYGESYPRERLTAFSAEMADHTDKILLESLSAKYVADPKYTFLVDEPQIELAAVVDFNTEATQKLIKLVEELLKAAGSHSRAYIKYGLEDTVP